MKVDPTVKKETGYIALWVFLFSLPLQAVFLILKKWDYTVLLGNLLSGALGILNFFLMGLTVQKAVLKEEKGARRDVRLSQTLRFLMLIAGVALGAWLPCFNIWAVLIPLFYPRIAIAMRPLFKDKTGGDSDE